MHYRSAYFRHPSLFTKWYAPFVSSARSLLPHRFSSVGCKMKTRLHGNLMTHQEGLSDVVWWISWWYLLVNERVMTVIKAAVGPCDLNDDSARVMSASSEETQWNIIWRTDRASLFPGRREHLDIDLPSRAIDISADAYRNVSLKDINKTTYCLCLHHWNNDTNISLICGEEKEMETFCSMTSFSF